MTFIPSNILVFLTVQLFLALPSAPNPTATLPPRFDADYPTMSLKKIISLAKSNNLDLQLIRQRIVQAELFRAKAWAILKPQLAIQGIYTHNDIEVSFDPGRGFRSLLNSLPEPFRSQLSKGIKKSEPIVISPRDQFAFQLQLRWAFLNLQSIPLLKIAYLSVDQVKSSAIHLQSEILFAVLRAYYGVLLADGIVNIARRSWLSAQNHLKLMRARYSAGVVPKLFVTRAQLEVAKARKNWINAQNGLKTAKLAIALLLNKPDLKFRPLLPPPPQKPSGSPKEWLHTALRHRPDLKAARLAVSSAQQGIFQAWSQFAPVVSLVGTWRGSNSKGFSSRYTQWSISLVAQLNLYSGGTRYLAVKEANSKLLQAKIQMAKTLQKIRNEISRAQIDLLNAESSIAVARRQLQLAEETFRLTEERYKNGVATPIEVSDTLTALSAARISFLREKLNRDIAVFSLLKSLGLFLKYIEKYSK